ncbi:MAG: hypothetical protein IPI91_02080 [Flavobacteriales bacterium]|nr:hypothetical protein [Flavobacteriales bacterium]
MGTGGGNYWDDPLPCSAGHRALAIRYAIWLIRRSALFPAGSDMLRFWKMEHIGTMIVAVALITIGRVLSKKTNTESSKQLRIAVFYLIGLLLMFAMIPWPFMAKFNHMYQWL